MNAKFIFVIVADGGSCVVVVGGGGGGLGQHKHNRTKGLRKQEKENGSHDIVIEAVDGKRRIGGEQWSREKEMPSMNSSSFTTIENTSTISWDLVSKLRAWASTQTNLVSISIVTRS